MRNPWPYRSAFPTGKPPVPPGPGLRPLGQLSAQAWAGAQASAPGPRLSEPVPARAGARRPCADHPEARTDPPASAPLPYRPVRRPFGSTPWPCPGPGLCRRPRHTSRRRRTERQHCPVPRPFHTSTGPWSCLPVYPRLCRTSCRIGIVLRRDPVQRLFRAGPDILRDPRPSVPPQPPGNTALPPGPGLRPLGQLSAQAWAGAQASAPGQGPSGPVSVRAWTAARRPLADHPWCHTPPPAAGPRPAHALWRRWSDIFSPYLCRVFLSASRGQCNSSPPALPCLPARAGSKMPF